MFGVSYGLSFMQGMIGTMIELPRAALTAGRIAEAGARVVCVARNVERLDRAVAEITAAFLAALDDIEQRSPGLHFCANFRGGPGVCDCLDSALTVSDRILAGLKRD